MKNTTLIFLIYFCLQGYSQSNLISGMITFNKDELGYSFVNDSTYYMGSGWAKNGELLNSIDIGWSDFNLLTPKYGIDGSIIDNRLIHLGKVNFNNTQSFDSNDWKFYYGRDDGLGPEDLINHVFVLKTHNKTYVKFIVRNVDWNSNKIEIEYIHQLNGTRIFD